VSSVKNVRSGRVPVFSGAVAIFDAGFRQGQMPVRQHAFDALDASDNDQVRRWRGMFNEEAEMPGARILGLCRAFGMAQAARNLAAAGGYCIGILQVSRMFHPASVGVAGAMPSCASLRGR